MPITRHPRSFTIAFVAAQLEDTLVGGYRRLAAETPRRRIDIELRALDSSSRASSGCSCCPSRW